MRRPAVVSVTALGALVASTVAYADGIDLSHWQGTVTWSKVKADGVSFAFMKATESSNYVDPTYAKNVAAAQAVGIYHGGYHFARPQVGTAVAQARWFVAKAGPFNTAGTLPPVLDLEVTGSLTVAQLRTWTTTWLTTVEELTGRTPIIYTSPSFWRSHLGDSTAFHHYPLWVAHWGVSSPSVPGGWPRWTFWQRTDSGTVSGIGGRVDMNRFNGSTADLAALALKTGGSTAPAPPGPTIPTGAATTVSLAASRTTSAINGSVTFSGDLTSTPAASPTAPTPKPVPVATRTVTLSARDAGSSTWRTVTTATTSTTGHFNVSVRVPRSATYRVSWPGDSTYAASQSGLVPVTTPGRTVQSIDLHATKPRVRPGEQVMIYGHVTAGTKGLAGRTVRIYKKPLVGGRWTRIATKTSLAPTGWYSTTVRPLRGRIYKAVTPGTLWYVGDTSNQLTVRMR
ncbi:MAG: hypothetical protein HOQ45_02730 [Nocardioidaceae bacterium]|nr:hypothetical protein [Nocardioidaceae bacterium]